MKESYKVAFARRLKERRIALGKTQDEVAEYLGTGRSSIANYEMGRNFPLTEAFLKLADCLNTSIDYLLGQTHDPEPFTDRGRLNISIENLEDLPLSYHGQELTLEQKRMLTTLFRSAMGLQEKKD